MASNGKSSHIFPRLVGESSTALFEDQLESEVLQFQGKDSQECEEFISAITKHAYNQGKLRDDEWIADLVATCLTHDALRWWSGLDKGTRQSWDKLRQEMFSRYQPKFYGKSGEEAEEFVHTVRQRARDAGKQKDNDWIINFVSNCFVGDALRWHVSLDQSIQDDWKMLQVAILVQWRREGGIDLPLKSGESPNSHSPIADAGITECQLLPQLLLHPRSSREVGSVLVTLEQVTGLKRRMQTVYHSRRQLLTHSWSNMILQSRFHSRCSFLMYVYPGSFLTAH